MTISAGEVVDATQSFVTSFGTKLLHQICRKQFAEIAERHGHRPETAHHAMGAAQRAHVMIAAE